MQQILKKHLLHFSIKNKFVLVINDTSEQEMHFKNLYQLKYCDTEHFPLFWKKTFFEVARSLMKHFILSKTVE